MQIWKSSEEIEGHPTFLPFATPPPRPPFPSHLPPASLAQLRMCWLRPPRPPSPRRAAPPPSPSYDMYKCSDIAYPPTSRRATARRARNRPRRLLRPSAISSVSHMAFPSVTALRFPSPSQARRVRDPIYQHIRSILHRRHAVCDLHPYVTPPSLPLVPCLIFSGASSSPPFLP